MEVAQDIINNSHDLNWDLAKNEGILGGSKIELVFADHEANSDKATTEASKLLRRFPGRVLRYGVGGSRHGYECMAGLNHTEIKEVMQLCRKIRENGLSFLIVEHIMEAIMPISDKTAVLNAGKKTAEGLPKDIVNNEEVIKAYLGDRYHAKSG